MSYKAKISRTSNCDEKSYRFFSTLEDVLKFVKENGGCLIGIYIEEGCVFELNIFDDPYAW